MVNKKWLYIIIIVIIILIAIWAYEFMGYKSKKCNKGCPVADADNEIYNLHLKYKSLRDENHKLCHSASLNKYLFNSKGPSNIFIIRHGEKIKTKFSLDCNGILRSTYIPSLVTDLNKNGFGIHSIVTAYDYNSMHKEQTIALTSWLMNIPIYMYGLQTQSEIAVQNIFTNPYFSGKTVLICWEHGCVQELVKNIIKIGPKIKGLNNYKFTNPLGNSNLPFWDTNNYQTIMYFDEDLNYKTFNENIKTCFKEENDLITYTGEIQPCK